MMNDAKIILLGATGYTGRLIASLLDEHEISCTLTARSLEKLNDLAKTFKHTKAVLSLDVTNEIEVNKSLNDFDIIINCIGPYNVWGKFVLEFCRLNGKIYIDISGEQYFIHESFLKNEMAVKSGATIIHSVSFESALAEILAEEMLQPSTNYQEISTYYFFDKSRPSPGTRLTMQLAKNFPTYFLENTLLKEELPLNFQETISFDFLKSCTKALFMPYPEVLFFQKRFRVKKSATYLLADDASAMLLQMSSKNPRQTIDAVIEKHHRVNPQGPDDGERAKQQFVLVVKAIEESGATIIKHVSGNDMYGMTAYLVVKLLRNVLNGHVLSKGVITPVEAGGWEHVLDELQQHNFIAQQS